MSSGIDTEASTFDECTFIVVVQSDEPQCCFVVATNAHKNKMSQIDVFQETKDKEITIGDSTDPIINMHNSFLSAARTHC